MAANRLRVFATNKLHARLCTEAIDSLAAPVRKRVTLKSGTSWGNTPWGRPSESARSLVVSRLRDFGITDPAPQIGRLYQYLMFMEGMPPESIADRIPRLKLRDNHRIHLAKSQESAEPFIVRRLISGIAIPDMQRILDAWWEHDGTDYLVVISPDYFRIHIPLSKLHPFIGDNRTEKFEIDDEGDFIHWPKGDVHFGWNELESLVDPVKAASAKTRNAEFAVQYGLAIRQYREFQHLSQGDIPGLDARHVRRIENGEVRLTSTAIERLAEAHGLQANGYLAQIAKFVAR